MERRTSGNRGLPHEITATLRHMSVSDKCAIAVMLILLIALVAVVGPSALGAIVGVAGALALSRAFVPPA